MTATNIVDPAGLLGEALSEASPDLMRSLLQTVINSLLSADADAVVGAEWGRPTAGRTAQRNGYRHRELDTRVGTWAAAGISDSGVMVFSTLPWPAMGNCSGPRWAAGNRARNGAGGCCRSPRCSG